MGMAASQARFLGLTARKTNVEYEGQQVNQQRTTLSNQSANYYNQLLGMSVPVPPSTADYTKTVYTFSDGAMTNSVSSLTAQRDGKFLVSYTSSWTNDFSMISATPTAYTRAKKDSGDEYEYRVGAQRLFKMNPSYTDPSSIPDSAVADGARENDDYWLSLSTDQRRNLLLDEARYAKDLTDKYGYTNNDWLVRYVFNSSSNTWSPRFVSQKELESERIVYDDNGTSLTTINTYTVGSAIETEEIKGIPARLEQDTTGRIINITLKPDQEDEVTYAVTTTTITDQAKYDDAMNQYEYDKAQYDKSVQEINTKIEIIQTEDKNLELRLKQLDTEQDAIQTEMDAVQKVIEKNTESTFKTFG